MENEFVVKAYKAGKEAGRVEIILEMLQDFEKEIKTKIPVDILNAMRHDDDIISAKEFISRYLPERYKVSTND